jgi:ssDNA-binding Zn-finger/Zn-ribbon topoisomerase 1
MGGKVSTIRHMREPANENVTFGPCPACGHSLRLGLIEPGETEHEKRTYQCDSCGHSEIKTVKFR